MKAFWGPQKHIYKGMEWRKEHVWLCRGDHNDNHITSAIPLIDFFWKLTLKRDSKIPSRTNLDFKCVLPNMVATNHMELFQFK